MNYEEACNYISDIPKFAPKTGLDNTRMLLAALGNPQTKYRNVHIAGTNGKGSVAKMTALMIESAGYRVGLFISPHLVRMNERISVNGEDISDEEFTRAFEEIKTAVDGLLAGSTENGSFAHPAYFEFLFAMAAKVFAEKECDFVVWETGLGGRLDATNTVRPDISIITAIGMDHMQYLGNTIGEIAGEKAGIIKEGVPVVYNTGEAEADAVIEKCADEKGSVAVNVNETVLPEELMQIIDSFAEKQNALYQHDNAYTASVALTELFKELGRPDAPKCIKEGLDAFSWPGRMEEIAPGLIIDGAHNEDAAKRFVESAENLKKKGGYRKISLLFAVCEDKDYESIIRTLCLGMKLENVYVAELNTARKTPAETIVELFRKYRPAGEYWNNYAFTGIEDALKQAMEDKDGHTLIMTVGSLYLVGEIRALTGKC